MPDISLLDPMVLRGVVEKFTAPENLVLLSRTPTVPWPESAVTWDVIKGSRMVAKPNVPNSEAHIIPRLGRSQESAAFLYLRDKKVFEPTTLKWLRAPGQIAAKNAEAAVLREIKDLNQRFDNFAEFVLWKALSGTLTLDYPDVQASVDYRLPATHKPFVGVSWATATPKQIVADIRAWKRLVQRDGRVVAKEAFTSEKTLTYIYDSFATTGATNFPGGTLLSDRMKDEYYKTGQLLGFMGLAWTPIETVYEADDSTVTQFVPDDALYMGNYTENRPIELFEGPTADFSAGDGVHTGKFAKTWTEEDPSARQHLLEWTVFPVVTRPEQWIYVASVLATS